MKKINTADKIIIALSVVLAAYGLVVLLLIGTGHWFNFAGLIVAAALIAFIPLKKRLNKAIKAVLYIIILLALLSFSIFEFKAIGSAVKAAPAEDAQWIMVLGAKANGGYPSFEFAKRLDLAADYAKEHDVRIILTGGKGTDEMYSEAEVALSYLKAKGIPEDRIVYENKSTSTSENFRFAKDVIGADAAEKDSIIVISSSFHLYRAGLLAEKEGYRNISFMGSTGKKILIPQYFAREYAAYVREEKKPF